MISDFFTTAFTVLRMQWVGDTSETISIGPFSGHLQQARPELTQQLDLQMTNTFSVWCEADADVEVGDVLVGPEYDYSVRAIQTNDCGANKHKELVIERNAPRNARFYPSVHSLTFSTVAPEVVTPTQGGGGGGSP